MSRRKHDPTADLCDSSSKRDANSAQRKTEAADLTPRQPKRASMDDLSSSPESQNVSEFHPNSTTYEKDSAIMQGILRAPSEFRVILVYR